MKRLFALAVLMVPFLPAAMATAQPTWVNKDPTAVVHETWPNGVQGNTHLQMYLTKPTDEVVGDVIVFCGVAAMGARSLIGEARLCPTRTTSLSTGWSRHT